MGLLPRELLVAGGRIALKGEDLLAATPARLRHLRGQTMGMAFQEPMTALNPVMNCGDQIDELLRTHTDWSATQRRRAVLDMLRRLGLDRHLHFVDASDDFLSALAGVVEPERKRQIIGDTFIAAFEREARRLGIESHLLGQGTI